MDRNSIFNIRNVSEFERVALAIFQFQAQNNAVYEAYLDHLKLDSTNVKQIEQIPFLPIQFFKTHRVISREKKEERVFLSSGTTGQLQSKHLVADLAIYEESFSKGFDFFYGDIEDYTVLALLPSYLERDGSSLVYMVDHLIKRSQQPGSGFYLNNLEALSQVLTELDANNKKTLLIGVSFALLDLVEKGKFNLKNTIIMETGGMKGRKKELIREVLHKQLCEGFGVSKIHSEYGMTELLSQAYSKGHGVFACPPWMKILIRDTEDALDLIPDGRSGGINVIDLSNINSCSFIATQDLGKRHKNGTFEVLGRFDHSDVRGCNLMVF